MLAGRDIVLGVSGGIAVYKAVDVVRRLRKLGATVHVIMTEHACKFVAPLTFESLSGRPVVVDIFKSPERWEVE
ncbi:MAG TPA: flavoprotein, partial [Clostridia bacterium]|nr:flavoprotein [Clostridia bacterium]